MKTASQITFHASPSVVVLAALVLLLVVMLAVTAFRKSHFDPGVGVLEALRVLIALLAVATLFKPEWKEVYQSIEQPTLVILSDDSGSMQTRDVVNLDDPAAPAQSRLDWSQSLPQSIWAPLDETMEVVTEEFSSFKNHADSRAVTDIDRALSGVLEDYNNLGAVVLISDGDWNAGESPANAATRFRIGQIPIYTVAVGSETALPDIEAVSLEPPTFSVVGKSLQIPFHLRSTIAVDYEVEVGLTIDSDVQLKKRVVIPAKGQVREAFFWTPKNLGSSTLMLDVPPHPEEVVHQNNRQSVEVDVRPESLKVLVVESLPRWEYRYLRNALERDPGVDVACLLFHPGLSKRGGGSGYIEQFPDSIEQLSEYDVVLLGDVGVEPGQLTPKQCTMIKGLVQQQASGLILMPGIQGNQFSLSSTDLKDLVPVVFDGNSRNGFGSRVPSSFELTELGRSSLLTKLTDNSRENVKLWKNLPGFQWRSAAVRHKAGSDVLAIHDESRAPLLVTKTYGTGKILFMGTDGAWRWRQGVEDKYHYRFWGQIARWMAYQRHMAEDELVRVFYAPDRPEPGNVITLNATVLDPAGVPLDQATVTADVVSPAGATEKIRFKSAGVDWGLYTARFTPHAVGSYQLILKCKETAAMLSVVINVHGTTHEIRGKPVRYDVLREIASISRGRCVPYNEVLSIRDDVMQRPPSEPAIRRKQIWASPYWAGTLIGVMSIFWIGRKIKGAL